MLFAEFSGEYLGFFLYLTILLFSVCHYRVSELCVYVGGGSILIEICFKSHFQTFVAAFRLY